MLFLFHEDGAKIERRGESTYGHLVAVQYGYTGVQRKAGFKKNPAKQHTKYVQILSS